MASPIIWTLLIAAIGSTSSQKLSFKGPSNRTKVCGDIYIRFDRRQFEVFRNCTVIHGNVRIVLYARTTVLHFEKLSYPELREITGYLMFHNIGGLRSVGQLFPNLARVRGEELIGDYAIMLTDMPNMLEVGLYNLLKIDRGGIIIWNCPIICYVHSVNWTAIAPEGRHVLEQTKCKNFCQCTPEGAQYCWNNIRCQRFLTGPDVEQCHDQCLGCAKTDPNTCTLCKHHTYEGNCVTSCPNHTLVLEPTNYCLTLDECKKINRFAYNGTCIRECPYEYRMIQTDKGKSCEWCETCDELKTCSGLELKSLQSILTAERCGIVNGSVEIHLYMLGEVMGELRKNLKRIREVTDYISIYGSTKIDSLDFFSSLRRIRGDNLEGRQHALKIKNMPNLKTLFPQDVIDNLKIDKGTFGVSGNPMLCSSEIMKLVHLFPIYPDISVAPGELNGYAAGCKESLVDVNINDIGFKSATFHITPIYLENNYRLFYAPKVEGEEVVPPEVHDKINCRKYMWHFVTLNDNEKDRGKIRINTFHPATTYAVCVEIENVDKKVFVRNEIRYFDTRVGRPPPPFISEVVAISSSAINVRWVNHIDYVRHITHYELDVILIDSDIGIPSMANCDKSFDIPEKVERHVILYETPENYEKSCYSNCENKPEILVQSKFDVNNDYTEPDFSYIEPDPPGNSSIGNYVKTLSVVMHSTDGSYQVKGLAPYRDYRVILRSCTLEKCSISAREVVRTLVKDDADYVDVETTSFFHVTGDFVLKWKAPKIINGQLFSYEVHIREKVDANSYRFLQRWCLLPNQLDFTVNLEPGSVYEARVCTITNAPRSVCTDYVPSVLVEKPEMYTSKTWMYGGFVFGVLLMIATSCLSILCKRRTNNDIEMVSLVGASAANRTESDPPLDESEVEIT